MHSFFVKVVLHVQKGLDSSGIIHNQWAIDDFFVLLYHHADSFHWGYNIVTCITECAVQQFIVITNCKIYNGISNSLSLLREFEEWHQTYFLYYCD